ncbi:MAG: nicotinamide-nucleotide adenylyltransferase [Candidatus Bathyarchaeota archaeon]|nr:MAG: nicotinamide-nucleotide adenylyltransferase [Candidatus Bathyarchaeota archaeon]
MRALYIGRFQPLHNGHVEAIKHIIQEVDALEIVIGSAQLSHSLTNPFTTGERIQMIRDTLSEIKADPQKCHIIPIPDAEMHATWFSTVLTYTPPFDIVYSNEPLTRLLFRESNREVKNIPFFKREIYSATEVRRRMLAGESWQALVPGAVVKIVEEIQGVERLQALKSTDSLIPD